MKRQLLALTLILSIFFPLHAQQTPFSKGVNLTNWFQYGTAYEIQFSRYRKSDFANIKSLGCDVIRLPLNLHFMTQGAPDHVLEPIFLQFLDSAVSWAEELDLHLILDNHTFDPAVSTDPAVEQVLVKVWKQMALHYRDRSDKIYYEVLNEPHGIADAIWGGIQGRVIDTIRSVDTKHTIIVGGADWNSYASMKNLPFYADTNLIYTFHFYDPFIFTHQGASWTGPSMEPLANIPFPYDANRMPPLPPSLQGSWIADAFNNYSNDGNVARMQQLLDEAVQFRNARNVPVFCGEFGVFIPNSNNADRVNWYREMVGLLDTSSISWTSWDYHGGFGLFEEGSQGLFDHDLNVPLLQAMGLNVPPQTPFVIEPDTAGFFVYREFVEPGIREAHYSNGPISFFAENGANYGQYHIEWSGASQYSAISFDFFPDKDLSLLEANDYALDFFARPSVAAENSSLDARFMDSKTTDPNDLPWRMIHTFKLGSGGWQHYHIPLSSFLDVGSWFDNTWHPSQGLYDWQATDRLEIVAENAALPGLIAFDHLQLTDRDTALVNNTTSVIGDERPTALVYPNPFVDQIYLKTLDQGSWDVQLLDMMGKQVWRGVVQGKMKIALPGLKQGMYVIRMQSGEGEVEWFKVWKK